MVGGVGKVQGPSQAHDFADQAFARLHAGDVDGFRVKALGGEELHVADRPAHVERADFRHHGLGDDADHHVQTRLCRPARGQGLADLSQQASLSANSGGG